MKDIFRPSGASKTAPGALSDRDSSAGRGKADVPALSFFGMAAGRRRFLQHVLGSWNWQGPGSSLLRRTTLLPAVLLVLAGLAFFQVHSVFGEDDESKAPSNLTAQFANYEVVLSWDAPAENADEVDGYRILRRQPGVDDVGSFNTIVENTGNTETAYIDSSVELGKSYTYRVRAMRGEDESAESNFSRVDLPDPASLAPGNLSVNLVDNRVTLTWNAPAADSASVDGYEILRRRPFEGEGALDTLVADTGSRSTSHVDGTANEAGVRYTYRVKALRDGVASVVSNYDFIDLDDDYSADDNSGSDQDSPTPTPSPTPEPEADVQDLAPTGLTAQVTDAGILLSWSGPAENADAVTGYEILRAVGAGELSVLVSDTESTAVTYTDATATTAGETYKYRVKAFRDEERSQQSGEAEVRVPHDPADLAPTGLTLETADEAVNLSWNAPAADAASVDQYQIERIGTVPGDENVTLTLLLTGSTATAWTDGGEFSPGGTYKYRVRAMRGTESSEWSNQEEFTVEGEASSDSVTEAEEGLVALPAQVDPPGNSPVTGSPAITGVLQVGRYLKADVSNLHDANGIAGADSDFNFDINYQWIRVDGTTETDIGTDLDHYLVPADAGKRIKLRISFTDQAGNAESATSQPTGVIGMQVKNTGQQRGGDTDVDTGTPRLAQAFTTGSNDGGYSLSRAGLRLNLQGFNNIGKAGDELTVTLNKHTDDGPGGVLCTLADPAGFQQARHLAVFAAPGRGPAQCPVLDPDTPYFLVLNRANSESGDIGWSNTASLSEDTLDPATGLTLEDQRWEFDGNSWTSDSGSELQLQLTGWEKKGTRHDSVKVPANWILLPPGFYAGDQFRLLFVTEEQRGAGSSNIDTYNAFVQQSAADGHPSIRPYSEYFRVVGSTNSVSARENTDTDITSVTGVPIYWMVSNSKVADNYLDFYDGSWDDEVVRMSSVGLQHLDSSMVYTGSTNSGKIGTWPLGSSSAVLGRPNTVAGPLYSPSTSTTETSFYGLSPVFEADPSLPAEEVDDMVVSVEAPVNWSLKPVGLTTGDKFRLLFVTRGKRDATSNDIADYNKFVQDQAAAGLVTIRPFSAGFRVLGSTKDVDAIHNTDTTPGVEIPIYWMGGPKVADNYSDLYDGDWDNEGTMTRSDGATEDAAGFYVATGSNKLGTAFDPANSKALGSTDGTRMGQLNYHYGGPLSAANTNIQSELPFYGLSQVFLVVD